MLPFTSPKVGARISEAARDIASRDGCPFLDSVIDRTGMLSEVPGSW